MDAGARAASRGNDNEWNGQKNRDVKAHLLAATLAHALDGLIQAQRRRVTQVPSSPVVARRQFGLIRGREGNSQ
ncbi:hypothetical protein J7T55_000512 [Diaporthe amygdali]|uniref:uncharacterized protein n=1 Tax=Phomopsis amygdali TaxID=1214568 RepID=UPI0022FE75A4|nr:uncharacterized protein J7T55_000512 [Diaporthe amygdali]KAJ0104161.1 hypothetical protein J7T55_000512 [Diaporthe amygdali]